MVTTTVTPTMTSQGSGSIVNMSSITWQVGAPELMGYASAKAAVVGFTHSLARQVGKHRIRVNAIMEAAFVVRRPLACRRALHRRLFLWRAAPHPIGPQALTRFRRNQQPPPQMVVLTPFPKV